MRTTFIYGLVSTRSITDVRYIGKTVQALRKRLYEHLHDYKNSYKKNWISKELQQGHEIKIILLDEVWEEDWDFWELYWIQEYSRRGHKLTNISPGGYQSDNMVEIVALDLNNNFIGSFSSIGQTARYFNLEERRVADCVRGVRRTYADKVFIKKDRYDLSKNYSTIKNPRDRAIKPIYQYDHEGNLIKKWDKIKDATDHYNVSNSVISNAAKQYGQLTSCGYIWLYTDDKKELIERINKIKNSQNRNDVFLYYKDTKELVGKFNSVPDLCRGLNLNLKQFRKGIYERGFYKNYIISK